MKLEFSCQYFFLKSVKQTCDFVAQTYSKVGNTAKVYAYLHNEEKRHNTMN